MEGRGIYRLADGTAEAGRYFAGADVGEGARWSADRKTAYRLRGGRVEEEISLEEAARIAGGECMGGMGMRMAMRAHTWMIDLRGRRVRVHVDCGLALETWACATCHATCTCTRNMYTHAHHVHAQHMYRRTRTPYVDDLCEPPHPCSHAHTPRPNRAALGIAVPPPSLGGDTDDEGEVGEPIVEPIVEQIEKVEKVLLEVGEQIEKVDQPVAVEAS